MMGHSILAVHAINNNRPVNLQSNKIDGLHQDTNLIPDVIPAASFSRQIKIGFLTSGSISWTEESADCYVSLSLSSGGSDAERGHYNVHRSTKQ